MVEVYNISAEIRISKTDYETVNEVEKIISSHFDLPEVEVCERYATFAIESYGEVFSGEVNDMFEEIQNVAPVELYDVELSGSADPGIRYRLNDAGKLDVDYGQLVYSEDMDAIAAWNAVKAQLPHQMLMRVLMEELAWEPSRAEAVLRKEAGK